MKRLICAALLAAASGAQAQVFLDPNIIRQAGEAAASGNLNLGNVQIDNVQIGGGTQQQRMPTAEEVAAELLAQQRRAQYQRTADEREARRTRVRTTIEWAYQAEFRK